MAAFTYMLRGKFPLRFAEKNIHMAFKAMLDGPGDLAGVADRPYFTFLRDGPHREDLRALAAAHDVFLPRLGKVRTVFEAFGGMGLSGTMIRGILRPESHVITDLDPDCVSHLRLNFPEANVIHGDAFEHAKEHGQKVDLLNVDWNRFTALDFVRRPPKIMTAFRGRYMIIADSAVIKLHLNASVYARELGMAGDTPLDYYLASDALYRRNLGMGIIGVYRFRGASLIYLRRGASVEFPVIEHEKTK